MKIEFNKYKFVLFLINLCVLFGIIIFFSLQIPIVFPTLLSLLNGGINGKHVVIFISISTMFLYATVISMVEMIDFKKKEKNNELSV